MASSRKFQDLKYEDEILAIEDVVKRENLPIIGRICRVANPDVEIDIPENTNILFQRISTETCAHIKVLNLYDNKKVEEEEGSEYVLEHDTFVGNEYLMPLNFSGRVKFVRRPESRGRYLTIKQVLIDSPAFVKVENETEAFLSGDMERRVMIPAQTILELKRKHDSATGVFLECTDGEDFYSFHEDDKVNFTVFEKKTSYSLTELTETSLLPKVILFEGINSDDAVLKEQTLKSAMLTMVEGPIELLGFIDVEYIIGWSRNRVHKTYETILIPKLIWSKIYVQKLCFYSDKEKESCIKRKYGECIIQDFVSRSLYLLPLDQCEVTWLRSPTLFKSNSTGNRLYDVVHVPYQVSSDEEEAEVSVYAEIEEPAPAIPERRPVQTSSKPATVKRKKSFLFKARTLLNSAKSKVLGNPTADKEEAPERPPRPKNIGTNGIRLDNDATIRSEVIPNEVCRKTRSLPSPPTDAGNERYTKLKFTKESKVYEIAKIESQNLEQPHTDANATNETKQALKIQQSQEDFFLYSVKEATLCFKNCGLTHLASLCSEQKLDGSFFKGFDDWNALNLSSADVVVLNKVIYEGWRPEKDEFLHAFV